MRALDIALATMALRIARARAAKAQRLLAPAVDDAGQALLDRAALAQDKAALVASLWPAPLRQCLIPARFALLAAPAAFGEMWVISRQPLRAPRAAQALARAA